MNFLGILFMVILLLTFIRTDEDSKENKEQGYRDYMDKRSNGLLP